MSVDRAKLLAAYDRALKAKARAEKRVRDICAILERDCDHPAAHVRPYHWEHDNGYGRQTEMVGRICGICLKKDHYASGWWG